jgi:hypothetical protein
MENNQAPAKNKSKMALWLKRIGWAGFLFFLIKGLVWIAVFYGGLRLAGCEG